MGGAAGTHPRFKPSNDPSSLGAGNDAALSVLRKLESKDAALTPRRVDCCTDIDGTAAIAVAGGDAAEDCSEEMGLSRPLS